MRHAIVLAGTGRYADPWHPFAGTSAALAAVATDAGFDCEVVTDPDAALAGMRTAALPDLVIANLGAPQRPTGPDLERGAQEGLDRMLVEAPLLALHAAVGAFPDSAAWEARLGGRWIDGRSFHPEFGTFAVSRALGDLPVTVAPEGFSVDDERYQGLRRADDNRVLFTHRAEDATDTPTIWIREEGGVRTAVDVLGHDRRSYESPGHTRVLGALMDWLAPAI